MTHPLITRLSKLDAPDREVDGEIWRYLMSGEPRAVLHGPIPKLTASVDAAIALAERVLPGWDYILRRRFAELRHPRKFEHDARGYAFNTATALLIALLRATEASHG